MEGDQEEGLTPGPGSPPDNAPVSVPVSRATDNAQRLFPRKAAFTATLKIPPGDGSVINRIGG